MKCWLCGFSQIKKRSTLISKCLGIFLIIISPTISYAQNGKAKMSREVAEALGIINHIPPARNEVPWMKTAQRYNNKQDYDLAVQIARNSGMSENDIKNRIKYKPEPIKLSKKGDDRYFIDGFRDFATVAPLLKFSNSNLRDISYFDVLISIPSDETEYINIFKETNQLQIEKSKNLKNKLVSEKNGRVKFPETKEGFLDEIRKNKDLWGKTLILIGHNENGHFYFPDGSYLTFKEMDNEASQHFTNIAYLSCYASHYTENAATNSRLHYSDAIYITNMIQKSFEYPMRHLETRLDINGSTRNFKARVDAAMAFYNTQKRAKQYTLVAVGGGTVAYGLYLVASKKASNPADTEK